MKARTPFNVGNLHFVGEFHTKKRRQYYDNFKDFYLIRSPTGLTLAKLRVSTDLLKEANLDRTYTVFVEVSIGTGMKQRARNAK